MPDYILQPSGAAAPAWQTFTDADVSVSSDPLNLVDGITYDSGTGLWEIDFTTGANADVNRTGEFARELAPANLVFGDIDITRHLLLLRLTLNTVENQGDFGGGGVMFLDPVGNGAYALLFGDHTATNQRIYRAGSNFATVLASQANPNTISALVHPIAGSAIQLGAIERTFDGSDVGGVDSTDGNNNFGTDPQASAFQFGVVAAKFGTATLPADYLVRFRAEYAAIPIGDLLLG